MQNKTFYIVLSSFILGVFLRSFWEISFTLSVLLCLVSGAVLFYIWYVRQKEESGENFSKTIVTASLCLLLISLGILRYSISERGRYPLPERFVGQKVSAEGVITEEPDIRDTYQRLTIILQKIASTAVSAKIITKADRYANFHYGDRVSLSGAITKPENFEPEAGARAFDYVSYLAKDAIYYEMKFPKISLIGEGEGNPIRSVLFKIKNNFIEHINAILSPPHSSLLSGLLVAGKGSLGKDLQDEFVRAGAIQVIVLSGYNVTLVSDAITKALSFLPRTSALSFGALGIILFVVLAGGTASIVRAGIMALVVILGKAFGRRYDVLRALCIAGALMIIVNPKILAFDPSFQLSFLATLGLILGAPLIAPHLLFLPIRFKIRETVTATIATQIFVLPFLLYQIGNLSLVALFTNTLIMMFVPFTMFVGFLATLLSYISIALAFPLTLISYVSLWYELFVVHFFSSLPFAAVQIPWFPWWLMSALYVLYARILFRFYTRRENVGDLFKNQL
ncbi:MAG: ComEC/Rec2 family competence protein [Candidatus Pacebacteria bacterium]|nr:ComEC/Rec2 family competence protein [Candidatus Paceibacterota bacterium]MDD5357287.1 ComEC/Rec2 family competence protein [Candidatus Paceibacterota bacterium]